VPYSIIKTLKEYAFSNTCIIPNSFHSVAAGKTLFEASNFPIYEVAPLSPPGREAAQGVCPYDPPRKSKILNNLLARQGPDEAAERLPKGWACSFFHLFL
jgi:hypothetical protein